MNRALRYHVESYGCQMNKLDSELVESRLRQAGYERARDESEADVVLLNTCSVRQRAEDRIWSRLGVLRIRKRQEPGLVVGVLGCMAQEHKRSLCARMPHVDLVVGPSAFGDIDRQIASARERALRASSARERAAREACGAGLVAVDRGVSGDVIRRDVRVRPHRSQAWVSIMRGCNMPCTYCIVPTTRGKEVSRPIAEIVDEAKRLCADGVSEITLLGQTVNAYGRDLGRDRSLARLLGALHDVDGLRRLAFITSHPNFLSKDLIAAIRDLPRVCRYLHLPAQSGSDRVLRAMKRGYTFDRYVARAERLLAEVPGIELHSDFIVGFPGETDADFARTVALMERVRFAQSYVFKYSPRPGTEADDLHDDVPDLVKAERNRVLLELQEVHTGEKNRALVGAVLEVLVEGDSKVEGRLSGRTAQHRIVHFDATDRSLIGRYVQVRIERALGHSLLGAAMLTEGVTGVSA